MLRRIYVNNFRCLVNFELKLDRVNLLLGENGTGKTSVFDVLYRLQQFVAGNAKVLTVFPSADLTRWQTIGEQRGTGPQGPTGPTGDPAGMQTAGDQRFELNLEFGECNYNYSLVIEHHEDRRRAKIRSEVLLLDGRKLFDFQDGQAQLFHDDFAPGPQYPFDWTQSGIGVLQPRHDNKKLTRFREEMGKIIIATVHPMNMSSESREDERALSRNMENFVSWYRYLSQEHQGAMLELFQELKQVIPGFSSFSLKEAGEAKVLKVMLERPGRDGRPMPYDFGELSDGQRALIALYSLLFGLKDEGVSLFLDEPDNFMALREIQPWLTALNDFTGEWTEQSVLISHHPEVIDYLALAKGRWFHRDDNGPTQVSEEPRAQVEGLRPSEAVARGWSS